MPKHDAANGGWWFSRQEMHQMAEGLRVYVFGEQLSRQWVVCLQKTGGYITIYRSQPDRKDMALSKAREMADFLGVPLVEEEKA